MFHKRLLSLYVALAGSGMCAAFAQDESNLEASSRTTGPVIVEEVIVQGIRQAELNAREAERNKKIFSSIIAQDDAGNFADQNVAESLQRLPGITLQKTEGEGRFVTIRGLGPGFVSVSQNGNEIASAGEDSRAFALDSLPSDLLGSIEVLKTLTPDRDLNSIGGSVNVKSISAFDKQKNTLNTKFMLVGQEYDDGASPKLALNGTSLLADDTIGLGYAVSWEKRASVVYQNLHHADNTPRYTAYAGNRVLLPSRFESRQENAERTRAAGSLTFEFRPTDSYQFKASYSHTEFDDLDVALREYNRWDGAGLTGLGPPDEDIASRDYSGDEFWFYDAPSNTYGFADTDLQHQFFIQDGKATTDALDISAEHFLDGGWSIDYGIAASRSKFNKPGGRRVQFRIRDLAMLGTHTGNSFGSTIVSGGTLAALSSETSSAPEGTRNYVNVYQPDSRSQPGMVFDNIFVEDSFRTDEIAQIKLNVEKIFETGRLKSIKFGASAKDRSRDRNKDRWSLDPSKGPISTACPEAFGEGSADSVLCRSYAGGFIDQDASDPATYGEFASFTPSHPDIKHDFITQADAETLLSYTSPIAYGSDVTQVNIDSNKDDYKLSEASHAVYLMAEYEPFDNATIIAGAKYEATTFRSSGNFSVRNDRSDDLSNGIQTDILVNLPEAKISYWDVLPSIHFNWEPSDQFLYRAALWTSFSRPGYDDARNAASISSRIEYCDDVKCGERSDFTELNTEDTAVGDALLFGGKYFVSPSLEMKVSNPNLRAMTATNLDASVSWFADDSLYLQAALFYKNIEDFIVTVRGADLALEQLPIELPIEVLATQMPIRANTVYDNVVLPVNGDVAQVWGTELSFSKSFNNGLFVFGNLTLQESDAELDPSLRVGKIALPDQADRVANFSAGWENDDLSLSVTTNYRSEVLQQVGACGTDDVGDVRRCQTWNDTYQDDTFSLDFKATWQISDQLNVFFDATNLTGDYTLEYLEGNQDSNGNIMYATEDFGSVYQAGINYRFF